MLAKSSACINASIPYASLEVKGAVLQGGFRFSPQVTMDEIRRSYFLPPPCALQSWLLKHGRALQRQ